MKKVVFVLFVALISTQAQSLDVLKFETRFKSMPKAALIDIRNLDEFNRGHIKKAVNVDFDSEDLDALMLGNFTKDTPIFLYDFTGGKTAMAVSFIKKLGYKQVFDLVGGFAGWTAASKPYVSSHTTTEPIAALTMNVFDKTLQSNPYVLIDFYADWCKPCKKMDPILSKIANEKAKKMKLLKVNTEENDALVNIFKVEAVPTYILFRNGKQVWRSEGEIDEKELREILVANKL